MSVAVGQDQYEMEKAKQFVAETPPIDGVQFVRIDFDEDHTGDPAMWLVFRSNRTMTPDLRENLEAAGRFNHYAAIIQSKILDAGLKRFPYTRLE